MATIEMMTQKLDDGATYPKRVFNVEGVVGAGGNNLTDDVFLVQTIFQAIKLEMSSFLDVPLTKANGKIDSKTIRAIWTFQNNFRFGLLAVDGKIHPASLENRQLRITAEKQTMIQQLNRFLWSVMTMREGGDDATLWLMKEFPELRGHVRDISDLIQI